MGLFDRFRSKPDEDPILGNRGQEPSGLEVTAVEPSEVMPAAQPVAGADVSPLDLIRQLRDLQGDPELLVKQLHEMFPGSQISVQEGGTADPAAFAQMFGAFGTGMPPQADPIAQLERLAALRDSGALTDAEFAAAKAKLLSSWAVGSLAAARASRPGVRDVDDRDADPGDDRGQRAAELAEVLGDKGEDDAEPDRPQRDDHGDGVVGDRGLPPPGLGVEPLEQRVGQRGLVGLPQLGLRRHRGVHIVGHGVGRHDPDNTGRSMNLYVCRAMPGLRERKKRMTFKAIHEAAMRLFAERGYGAVTVADIADAADVSRATVFAYYPAKEDIVLGEAPLAIEALAAALDAAGERVPVVETVREWLRGLTGWVEPDIVLQRRLAEEVPAVNAARSRVLRGIEAVIAEALARELGPGGSARAAARGRHADGRHGGGRERGRPAHVEHGPRAPGSRRRRAPRPRLRVRRRGARAPRGAPPGRGRIVRLSRFLDSV